MTNTAKLNFNTRMLESLLCLDFQSSRMISLTPEGHEYGEDDGGAVIEEVHDPGVGAGLVEVPVAAEVVARRADLDVVRLADVSTAKDRPEREGDEHWSTSVWFN